jgi:phage-related protein
MGERGLFRGPKANRCEAAQRLADEPRPDLKTAAAARLPAQYATSAWRAARARDVGSIGLLGHMLHLAQRYKFRYNWIVASKALIWVGTSLERVRAFPEATRREAGHQLHRVQLGLEPGDWKPMRSVGPGVVEIRIHEQGEYRVLYVAKFSEGVYVLHAFPKKTQQTRQADIEIARRNLTEVLRQRTKG